MLAILCILIGLFLGQHIRLSISPELSAFLQSTWSMVIEQAPVIKASTAAGAKRIQSTIAQTLKAAAKPTLSSGEVA